MSTFSIPRHRPSPGQHKLSAADYYRERQDRRLRKAQGANQASDLPSMNAICNADNLLRVYHRLAANAGQAPGPDRVTYADLGRGEAAGIMRELSKALKAGTYRPGNSRRLAIPKSTGQGHRILTIRSIVDRVVAAALNDGLSQHWNALFLPGSVGFRPGKSVWHLLARLEQTMTEQERWVLATEDIKSAFDNVVIDDVLADHSRHINDPRLLALIEAVLRGHEGQNKKLGIDQGCPYSPTALNVRLHYAHDVEMNDFQVKASWYRYADNLAYACQSVTEGNQVLDKARQLLETAGFSLKGEADTLMDLQQGQRAQLLGLCMYLKDGRLVYDLGRDAWGGLEMALRRAHEAEDPPLIARLAINGWINAQGPAFESQRNAAAGRILDDAAAWGFREIALPDELWERWKTSHALWCAFREKVHHVCV